MARIDDDKYAVNVADIDKMMESVSQQMPMPDSDHIYLWELSTQAKIYTILLLVGIMAFVFAWLL